MAEKLPEWVKTSEDYDRWKKGGALTASIDLPSGYKKCPFCLESIVASATKCKYCTSDIALPITGEITIVGYIGIVLGVLLTVLSFVVLLHGFLFQSFCLLVIGLFFGIGCYRSARRN